jgi:hypothetical protein
MAIIIINRLPLPNLIPEPNGKDIIKTAGLSLPTSRVKELSNIESTIINIILVDLVPAIISYTGPAT